MEQPQGSCKAHHCVQNIVPPRSCSAGWSSCNIPATLWVTANPQPWRRSTGDQFNCPPLLKDPSRWSCFPAASFCQRQTTPALQARRWTLLSVTIPLPGISYSPPLTRMWSGTAYFAILEATIVLSSSLTRSIWAVCSFSTMKAKAPGRQMSRSHIFHIRS